MVFIDEYSINTARTRTPARSLKGERAEVIEPFNRGRNLSVIRSLSLTGVGATRSIEGAVDTQAFDALVEHFLVPTRLKDEVVFLDNVKFHDSERAVSLIEAAGARVLHIPTDSPDVNPIEERISKIKARRRAAKARTKRKLLNALAKAIKKITVDNICGWFADCGYIFSFI